MGRLGAMSVSAPAGQYTGKSEKSRSLPLPHAGMALSRGVRNPKVLEKFFTNYPMPAPNRLAD